MAGDGGPGWAGGGRQAAAAVRRVAERDWDTLRRVRLAALTDSPDAFGSTLARELALGEDGWRRRIATAVWFLGWPRSPLAHPSGLGDPPELAGPSGLAGPAGVPEPSGLAAIKPGKSAEPAAGGPAGREPVPAWELMSMWVAPAARGSGLAGKLVAAAAGHARSVGASRLTLWVAAGNARARGFYLSSGFQPTGMEQTFHRSDGTAFEEEELALGLLTSG